LPTITKLKSQKNKSRVNLYLDGKFTFGLSLEEVVSQGLFVGQKLTEKELEKLFFSSQLEKLYHRTLNFLSYRPRSEKEITDYLKKNLKGNLSTLHAIAGKVERKIQSKILKKLKKLKLLDDFKFASWWIEQRLRFRPKGKKILKLELLQKGVDQKIIDSQISQINQINAAKKIINKKLKLYKSLPKLKLKQKLFSHLARRGFEFPLIKKVVDEEMQKD